MSNGQHQQTPQPQMDPGRYVTMGEPISGGIKMNLDLSWRQIAVVFGGLWTIIGSLGIGGVLFMPAKDSEFQPVRQAVDIMRTETAQNRESIARLTVAVDNLSHIVERFRDEVPEKVLEKVIPKGLGKSGMLKLR